MKKYVSPELECTRFCSNDVITASGEVESNAEFSSEEYGFEREWL